MEVEQRQLDFETSRDQSERGLTVQLGAGVGSTSSLESNVYEGFTENIAEDTATDSSVFVEHLVDLQDNNQVSLVFRYWQSTTHTMSHP